jgi:uncharacterized protein
VADIFELIDAGDVAGIERLLAAEPEAAAARDERGLSALVRAAYRGQAVLAAVRAAQPPLDPWDRLLVGESDGLPAPDSWSPDGFTPLHIAAFSHNLGATRALLAAGADPNVLARVSFARVTPLGTAATFRAVDVAAALLDGGADSEVTADHGFTPLHAAAANGDRALVELLLERGARTDARNERGQTPADLATDDAVRAVLTRC